MGQESMEWEGKPSWLNYPAEWVLVILFLPAMGLGLLLIVLVAIKRSCSEYKITSQRVVSKTGVLNSRRAEVEVGDIRNLNVTQNLWQRLCGIGTVEISSAGGGGIEVAFAGVADPEGVKERIRLLRSRGGGATAK